MTVVVNKGITGTPLPRLDGENPDVFPGSPLSIIGLWIFALRQRFIYNNSTPMPWVWVPDLVPKESEDANPLPDGEPRKILIESSYNTEKANRNYYPAIYVGRSGGDVTADKISINNFVGQYTPTSFKAFHCYATMPVVFECESENQGESSIIAETAWAFVLTTRDIFRGDFGLHDILEPRLGDTTVTTRDKTIWSTNVQFRVTYDVRWGITPIAPKLREILLNITRTEGVNRYLTQLVTRE